jgi:hypothetical protein
MKLVSFTAALLIVEGRQPVNRQSVIDPLQ